MCVSNKYLMKSKIRHLKKHQKKKKYTPVRNTTLSFFSYFNLFFPPVEYK